MQETQVQSLGRKDPLGEGPLEKEMAVHFSILAREIPRTEEPGGLQSMGSQKSQTNTATSRYIHVAMAAKCTPGNSYFFVKDVLLVNIFWNISRRSSMRYYQFTENWFIRSFFSAKPRLQRGSGKDRKWRKSTKQGGTNLKDKQPTTGLAALTASTETACQHIGEFSASKVPSIKPFVSTTSYSEDQGNTKFLSLWQTWACIKGN